MAPSILVIGAGGNFGPSIMGALLARKADFARIGILTSSARRSAFSHLVPQGVEIITSPLTEVASYKGFEIVISLAGNSIMALQPAMIDAAISAGARHFYPSEFGGDIGREPYLSDRYFRDKHLTRALLAQKANEIEGFKYTLVMCGLFAEVFADYEGFGLNKKDKTMTFYGSEDTEWSFAWMADIARLTVASIFIPIEPNHSSRELRIPNGNWKLADAVRILGEVRGVEYKFIHRSVEEAKRLQEHYAKTGEVEKELIENQKVQAGRTDVAIPKPWDNHLFEGKQLELREMFERIEAFKQI